MPALAPCCLPEANSCDEQQSFQCAEWPGDWYGTMGNVTQQSWLGSNCNALQVFFCQYGTYYSSQLYDCGMECPVDPVLGCMDPDALNRNPDATEDDGSCEYPPPSPTYSDEGLGNVLPAGKRYTDGYDYTGTGYGFWHNYADVPAGSGGIHHFSLEDLGVGNGQYVEFFAQGKIDQDRADDDGVVRFYIWFISPTDGWVRSAAVSVSATDWQEVAVTLGRNDEYDTDPTYLSNSCGWFRVHYEAGDERLSECIEGTPTGYYWGHPTNPSSVAHSGHGTDHGYTNRGTCYAMDGAVVGDPFYQRADYICMCGEGGACERPAPTHVRFGIFHYPNDINVGTSSFANAYIPYWEPIYGCMDEDALNYNPDANFNDDSCAYPPGPQPPTISVQVN